MGGEELKWRQLAHHQLMSQHKGFILVHTVKLKPITKAQISGKLVTIGISDVVTASLHSEKTRMKKLIMIIIIMNIKITRNDGFSRAPEIDFRYELISSF